LLFGGEGAFLNILVPYNDLTKVVVFERHRLSGVVEHD